MLLLLSYQLSYDIEWAHAPSTISSPGDLCRQQQRSHVLVPSAYILLIKQTSVPTTTHGYHRTAVLAHSVNSKAANSSSTAGAGGILQQYPVLHTVDSSSSTTAVAVSNIEYSHFPSIDIPASCPRKKVVVLLRMIQAGSHTNTTYRPDNTTNNAKNSTNT